ncbi:hypothetical protein L226DRAFT_383914 [Lentinus tigrinus ALCF2SS1-7]|uniref:uncharacterized protein n=1 Tax=Lentinus tigrinus ALCF2SS1-7 TaxID=1328758 RepID=UPI001165DB58|nr:hypothetical protein L226DRAFT_383914 [Lentinus tigrinus ALCF2SS1-7]
MDSSRKQHPFGKGQNAGTLDEVLDFDDKEAGQNCRSAIGRTLQRPETGRPQKIRNNTSADFGALLVCEMPTVHGSGLEFRMVDGVLRSVVLDLPRICVGPVGAFRTDGTGQRKRLRPAWSRKLRAIRTELSEHERFNPFRCCSGLRFKRSRNEYDDSDADWTTARPFRHSRWLAVR